MNKLRAFSGLALVLATGVAVAGQAEICYSSPQPSTPPPPPPTNDTVFNCPTIGSQTLPQIAALGWEVVQLTPWALGGSDPMDFSQANQLIVQKSANVVLSDRFEK